MNKDQQPIASEQPKPEPQARQPQEWREGDVVQSTIPGHELKVRVLERPQETQFSGEVIEVGAGTKLKVGEKSDTWNALSFALKPEPEARSGHLYAAMESCHTCGGTGTVGPSGQTAENFDYGGPCPDCSKLTRDESALAAALAEIERLRTELAGESDNAEQWSQEIKRLAAENAKLRAALQKMLRIPNTCECMGEWSALEINSGLYKKEAAKVSAVMAEARAALEGGQP